MEGNADMNVDSTPKFPFDRGCPFDPPPVYAEFRAECPVRPVAMWDGSEAWLVTRYEDVRTVLQDPRYSADTSQPGFPQPNASMAMAKKGQRSFIRMDPPQHGVHRAMLARAFTVRAVERLRGDVELIVDGLLDSILQSDPPVDLVARLGNAVPAATTCRFLDLPIADAAFFEERIVTWTSFASTPEEVAKAANDVLDYFSTVIEQRNAEPGDDLISSLVVEQLRPGNLTFEELRQMLWLLLIGGFDTTANVIALGILTLLQYPQQRQELADDPALMRGAVEEMLRYTSISHFTGLRLAREPVELHGVRINPGEGVIAPIPAANRDPDVFPDPDVFDIHRDSRAHVAFGFGVHQCIGQPLARLMLQTVYAKVFARIPTLRLAIPFEDVRFKHDALLYGVWELPVEW